MYFHILPSLRVLLIYLLTMLSTGSWATTQERARIKEHLGTEDRGTHAKLSTQERASKGGLRILALTQPLANASQSHLYMLTWLSEHLISKGHQVMMPLHAHMTSRSKQVEVISYRSSYNASDLYALSQRNMNDIIYNNLTLQQLSDMLIFSANECDMMLSDVAMHNQLKERDFDVAIVDNIFTCGFLYAERLNLPVIILEVASFHSSIVDTPDPFPLAYVPMDLSGFSQRMGFIQRIQNAVLYYLFVLFFPTIMYSPFEGLHQRYGIGDERMRVAEIVSKKKRNAKLWIVNQSWAQNYPRPLLPNVVTAGGILTRPAKPLPQDLESVYTAAGETGVILVTFGSFLSLEGQPAMEEAILTGLSRLPHTVIYVARHDVPHLPPNVKVWKHIPQNDLLGHSKTKAAVLHGGINGVHEIIYHAVPSLVIPLVPDGMDNAVRLRDKGISHVISPYDVTADRVHAAILELLTNQSYKDRAKQLSAIFRDQPQTPVEKAAFWVEHVMRHGMDTDYLRPAGLDLYWWQLYMVDVIAVFLLFTAGIVTMFVVFVKLAIRMYRRVLKFKVD